MFLYLLNDNEGKAFMELAIQAMKVNGEEKDCEKAEYETYLTELNLTDYEIVGMVKEYDAETQTATILQKNRVFEGDEVEVLNSVAYFMQTRR